VGPVCSTQPNPSQSKNFGPTNQPKPQPITQLNTIQATTNLRAQGRPFFTVSESLSCRYFICQVIRYRYSSHKRPCQVLEFLETFLTHNPTQPNPTRGSTQPMDNSVVVQRFNSICWLLITRINSLSSLMLFL